MRYHEYNPHEILRDSVKCFWIHEGDYSTEATQDITPDGCVELIFNFGDPYLLRTTTPPTALPVAIIVGFQNKTIPLLINGTVRVVAARLFAWGAMALLQENVATLTNSMTALCPDWNALVQRLKSLVTQGQYEQAATALEEFLVQQALVRTYDLKFIQTAAKLLDRTKGQYRISELADYCQVSLRQLQRGFQQVIGTSPKTFARTLRFQEAQRRLMFDPDADLTDLAYECGYFDQAHFNKDFKAITGKTPSEYAGQMRDLQEIWKSEDVVFLQSSSEPDV
ncbi:MAG TPA: helix-turn-helix domain-containing protein [Blastocatellia bacterium]|nr:helix-turn-helix domain-containing protein [Blastocatellia bacterium]